MRCYLTFLTQAERNLLANTEGLSKSQQRYIRYKLRKKVKRFYDSELPLLIDKGYITTSTGITSYYCTAVVGGGGGGSVAANASGVASGSHAYEDNNDKKEQNPRSNVAVGYLHAPWSGGEQCKQDPCRKAYGITSHRAWQTASSG